MVHSSANITPLHLVPHSSSVSAFSQLDFSQCFDHTVLSPASRHLQTVPSALRACPRFFRFSQASFSQRKLSWPPGREVPSLHNPWPLLWLRALRGHGPCLSYPQLHCQLLTSLLCHIPQNLPFPFILSRCSFFHSILISNSLLVKCIQQLLTDLRVSEGRSLISLFQQVILERKDGPGVRLDHQILTLSITRSISFGKSLSLKPWLSFFICKVVGMLLQEINEVTSVRQLVPGI